MMMKILGLSKLTIETNVNLYWSVLWLHLIKASRTMEELEVGLMVISNKILKIIAILVSSMKT